MTVIERFPNGELKHIAINTEIESPDIINARAWAKKTSLTVETRAARRIIVDLLGSPPPFRKEQHLYAYYKTGEIDTITMYAWDATGALISERVLKHYTDGRQPQWLKPEGGNSHP